MSKCQDTYKEVKTYKRGNMIINVHIPDLTEEERARRMKDVYKAAEGLLKEVIRLEMAESGQL